MKKKRFSEEQKLSILREADSGDKTIVEFCRTHGISDVTFYVWRRKLGEMSEIVAIKQKLLETFDKWRERYAGDKAETRPPEKVDIAEAFDQWVSAGTSQSAGADRRRTDWAGNEILKLVRQQLAYRFGTNYGGNLGKLLRQQLIEPKQNIPWHKWDRKTCGSIDRELEHAMQSHLVNQLMKFATDNAQSAIRADLDKIGIALKSHPRQKAFRGGNWRIIVAWLCNLMILFVSAFMCDYGKSKRFVVSKSLGMLRKFPIAFRRARVVGGVGPCSSTFICASAVHTRRNGRSFRKPHEPNPMQHEKKMSILWIFWMRITGRRAGSATSRMAGASRLRANKSRLGRGDPAK